MRLRRWPLRAAGVVEDRVHARLAVRARILSMPLVKAGRVAIAPCRDGLRALGSPDAAGCSMTEPLLPIRGAGRP